ncbi:ABC transporter substrate-binding protein [Acuticoccus sp. M5D2P5]|uniref:ABC transporter substrate-binding protein n=1 Tax=Acuticoccus kalidii TaxID=2910977 RepID=UPI001F4883CC|nr:ABC transporter substrate-binding protein [Acuticoccus kalidii]MCF3934010.1 ABC transporter substrate-binding protein [Acuticoccus kalidii]
MIQSTVYRSAAALLGCTFLFAAQPAAQAEGSLRIVEQFGLTYLPLHVMRDQELIAKHAAAHDVEIDVEWRQVSGGAAANDALLSGSVDVVAAGIAPLLTIWDRTRGNLDVRGIAAIGAHNSKLVTNNPNVKTIADFTEADRIAVPSVGVSQQARTLQMAAMQLWGTDAWDRLDRLTVALPHPDATQAILSTSGSVTAHFSNEPFQYQELAAPGTHVVTDSVAVFGGEATSTVVYAAARWREDNPKTYAAFLDALDEASDYIEANPEGAADVFLRVSGSGLDRDLVIAILNDPGMNFGTLPLNTEKLARFMHEVGAIRTAPETWQDYFFDDIHDRPGS